MLGIPQQGTLRSLGVVGGLLCVLRLRTLGDWPTGLEPLNPDPGVGAGVGQSVSSGVRSQAPPGFCIHRAVGCIMGELLNGSPLFPGENDIEQLCCVLRILGTPDPQVWPVRRGPWWEGWGQVGSVSQQQATASSSALCPLSSARPYPNTDTHSLSKLGKEPTPEREQAVEG